MADPAPREGLRSPSESPARKRSATGRIALAFAVSLLVHALAIWALRLPPPREETRPGFLVQVTGVLLSPPVASAPVTPPAQAATAPREEPAAPSPAPSAPVASPPAPLPPTPREATPAPAETPAPAPSTPLAPAAGELARHLQARRLPVTLVLDASGTVTQAQVPLHELAPEVAAKLEAALLGARVGPRSLEGLEAGTPLRTRLCFDDAGLLESPSAECLQVDGTPSR